jgi:hypothetical protein
MALPNDISKIGQIANAVYNSVTANNTAVTALSISNNSVYPSTGGFRRNRIINGAMQVDQRNSGASFTPGSGQFLVDRWAFAATQTSKFTIGQNLNSATTIVGYPNYLGCQSSSAYTILAGDIFSIYHPIEGFNFADLGFGTASAQTVTFSFIVYSSLTGTFGGTLKNFAATRSYPFSYLIPTANTWTFVSVTIAGDTSGTWVGSTNAGSAIVQFGLGVGSTYSGTAGAWSSSNLVSATGAVSVVGTNGATFYVTGVQLEAGSVATPFERLPIGEMLMLCQRYCNVFPGPSAGQFGPVGSLYGTTAGATFFKFPVTMRTAPTLSGTSNAFEIIGFGPVTGTVANISINNQGIKFDGNSLSSSGSIGQPLVYEGPGILSAEL